MNPTHKSVPPPRLPRARVTRKPAPSPMPKKIDDSSWWYEDKHGIDIVVEPTDRTVQKRIGWSALLKAAARCRPELFNPSLLRAAKFLAMDEREQVATLVTAMKKAEQEDRKERGQNPIIGWPPGAFEFEAKTVLAAMLGTGRGKRGRR